MGLREQVRDTVLGLAPLRLLRMAAPRAVAGVNYHLIGAEARAPHVRPLYAYKTPEQFEDDLKFLNERYVLVSYDDVAAHVLEGKKLPSGAALVTFDDGFAECHSVAQPLLLKHSAPAVFFIITGALDNAMLPQRHRAALCMTQVDAMPEDQWREFLAALDARVSPTFVSRGEVKSWLRTLTHRDSALLEEVCALAGADAAAFLHARKPFLTTEQTRDLNRNGFTIGAHTVTHPDLSLLDQDAATSEIVDSCAAVQGITGAATVPLAIPFNGNRPSREFLGEVRRRYPHVGLYFNNCGFPLDHPTVIGRISCDSPDGSRPGQSNLPRLLKRAYARGLVGRASEAT